MSMESLLVLNQSARIFTSQFIMWKTLGKESCEQMAFVSPANKIYLSKAETFGRSLMYSRNNRGPKFEPCATPTFIGFESIQGRVQYT